MPVINPDYKENWEEIHDKHSDERERLRREINEISEKQNAMYKAGQHDSDAYKQFSEEREELFKRHGEENQACIKILSYNQHKTIQDAARYFLKDHNLDTTFSNNQTINQFDLEQFSTIDEVFDFYTKAVDASEKMAAEVEGALPVGKINGTDIFEDIGTNQITSTPITLTGNEVSANIFGQDASCELLVTVDKRANGEYHICLTQSDEMGRNGGLYLQPHLEGVATEIYRQIKQSEEQNATKGALSSLMDKIVPNRGADKFNFYIHHPPKHLQREMFFPVGLKMQGGRFDKPDWRHSDNIPAKIKEAYKNFATPESEAQISKPVTLEAKAPAYDDGVS